MGAKASLRSSITISSLRIDLWHKAILGARLPQYLFTMIVGQGMVAWFSGGEVPMPSPIPQGLMSRASGFLHSRY